MKVDDDYTHSREVAEALDRNLGLECCYRCLSCRESRACTWDDVT